MRVPVRPSLQLSHPHGVASLCCGDDLDVPVAPSTEVCHEFYYGIANTRCLSAIHRNAFCSMQYSVSRPPASASMPPGDRFSKRLPPARRCGSSSRMARIDPIPDLLAVVFQPRDSTVAASAALRE